MPPTEARPPSAPGTQPASARPRPRRALGWALLVALAVALVAGTGLLATSAREDGPWLKLLAVVAEPQLALLEGATGLDAAGRVEYVVFLQADPGDEALGAFFAQRPGMALARRGDFADTLVVALEPPVAPHLDDLRAQPFVGLVLPNRAALVCH